MHWETFPAYAELVELLEGMVRNNRDTLHFEAIGTSAEGREIRAIHVAGDESSFEDKEVVLIVCGRHGDEVGTRVVGPCVLDWLLSEEAAPVLQKQHVIVVPVANPDGCEKEMFGLPSDRLSRMEKESILRVAERYIPDLVIDVHSVGRQKHGYDWGGLQAVVIDHVADAGEDRHIAYNIAGMMIEAACAEGELFLLHDVGFYRRLAGKSGAPNHTAFNNYFNRACYDAFHSLNFGIEVNHFVMTPDEVGRSATVIIKSLLRQGNHRFAWERHAGYPNRLLKGDFLASIRAFGETSGQRRRSRQNAWKNISAWDLSRNMPDPRTIQVQIRFAGARDAGAGAGASFFLAGRRTLSKVLLNGTAVAYWVAKQECGVHVFVDVQGAIGNGPAEILVQY